MCKKCYMRGAWLALSVEGTTIGLRVVNSTPMLSIGMSLTMESIFGVKRNEQTNHILCFPKFHGQDTLGSCGWEKLGQELD